MAWAVDKERNLFHDFIVPYFPDLSPYSYAPFKTAHPHLLNVGWLDVHHPYTKGEVSETVVKRVLYLCRIRVNQTRGWHRCPFCALHPVIVKCGGDEFALGDSEIRVRAEGDIEFAAPNLIYHYIREHQYRPPDAFLHALEEHV